jgi:hypothetical protein
MANLPYHRSGNASPKKQHRLVGMLEQAPLFSIPAKPKINSMKTTSFDVTDSTYSILSRVFNSTGSP